MNNYKFTLNEIDKNFGLAKLKEKKPFSLHTQSFSGTDTNKQKGNVGIVYPFDCESEVKGFVTASSIIDHHNGDRYLLKHTEVRVCNNDENQTLLYEKLERTIPVIIHENKALSEARNDILFEKASLEDISLKANDDIEVIQMKLQFIDLYKEFQPLVIISEKNLEKKSVSFNRDKWIAPKIKKVTYIDDNFPLEREDLEAYFDEFQELSKMDKKLFYSWYEYAIFCHYGESNNYGVYVSMENILENFRKEHKLTEKKIAKDTKKAEDLLSNIDEESLFDYGEFEW